MMQSPRYDFHIHTKYLGCANATMEVEAIVEECARLGVTALGFTDHVNNPGQLDLHKAIKQDIERLDTGVEVFFGVELNFDSVDGDFVYDEDIREQYGFQFAIGGIHGTYLDAYDVEKIVAVQHRHHLKTCRNPLVDVLVHPYWFGKGEFDRKEWPWFDTMSVVPEGLARELGQAARETGTAIEINAAANLTNPNFSRRYREEYVAFLSVIAEEGACFALGSDAHDIGRLKEIEAAWEVAEQIGLPEERIWRPRVRLLQGKARHA